VIITKKRDFARILDALKGRQSVFLFGCGACAEQCRTGGKDEIEEMRQGLAGAGVKVVGSAMVEETCYRQRILKEFRSNQALKGVDAILVLACGAGVRTVADAADETTPVLPALDSLFLATVERYGRFFEGCSLCGECVLDETAGICPHTECPKGMLNGPCGGVAGGMCEVNTENRCAWVRIYERLRAQGRLHLMKKTAPPKDHSNGTRPRKVLLRNPAGPTRGRDV
jgi:ferredoxin